MHMVQKKPAADLLAVDDTKEHPASTFKRPAAALGIEKKLLRALKSNNPRVRYWAVTASAAFGENVKPLLPLLKELLDDTDAQVRIRTAEVLGSLQAVKPQATIYDVLATSDSNAVAAAAMNAIVFLQDHHDYEFNIDASMIKASDEPLVQRRLEYLNAE